MTENNENSSSNGYKRYKFLYYYECKNEFRKVFGHDKYLVFDHDNPTNDEVLKRIQDEVHACGFEGWLDENSIVCKSMEVIDD